jgi:GNAT superfamily N-acetyltransferase/SAM-dependent methyltransferase
VPQPQALEIGTFWGLTGGTEGITKALARRALWHLKGVLGVTKVVALASSPEQHRVLVSMGCGFSHGNALVCPLPCPPASASAKQVAGITFKELGAEGDSTVLANWAKMWAENGVGASLLRPDWEGMTLSFMADARKRLHYKTFAAIDEANGGQVVGTVSCQVHAGAMPVSLSQGGSGSVWAVYVEPSHRRRGIGTRLMQEINNHFQSLGLPRVTLIYASQAGCCLYLRCGYTTQHQVVVLETKDLASPACPSLPSIQSLTSYAPRMVSDLRAVMPSLCQCSSWALLSAIPLQLPAVAKAKGNPKLAESVMEIQQKHSVLVSANLSHMASSSSSSGSTPKFGSGFDLSVLSQSTDLMAAKFDRLSTYWREFVTGCGYAPVWDWLCGLCSQPLSHFPASTSLSDPAASKPLCVVDACCGVGFPGQTLRLMGYSGLLVGCDISTGMMSKAASTGCFDELYVADVQKTLAVPPGTVDVVVCTGSMELLNCPAVLQQCRKALKPNAELWVSFQWEEPSFTVKPTAHQNISGISQQEAAQLLDKAGFLVLSVVQCPRAFVTPKPVDGAPPVLLDVPYLFCRAKCK